MESNSDPTSSPTVVEASGTVDRAPILEPDVGPEIGRYLVIDEIGAGGMGRVFRAYDPKLGREVALKRLRLRAGADRSDGARMLREAKAMAMLAHPNVVPIYDVDIDQGSLFIAMEYVRGLTLKTWVVTGQHPWREVLAMFVQAGRGLAAAHAQGIVHRDFKPGNVVVGEDGRARVMDFGLARAVGGSTDDPLPDGLADHGLEAFDSGGASRDLGATLTELGTVVGTPNYMAPEQHRGSDVDARTDQYSFCVALWEALHRQKAFTGRSLAELAAAKAAGPPRSPGTGVPPALDAIVVRGMASAPDGRWPDMTSLLAALEQLLVRKTRLRWIAVGLGAASVAAVVWVSRAAPCTNSDAELDQVWNDDARTRLEDGLRASATSYAGSTIERVVTTIEADADAWRHMHRESCEATRVRHEQSDEALDLRMSCLRAHRQELGAAIELLAVADASVAEHAIEVVSGLPPLSRCADVAALRERVPPPDEADARVDDVRVQLQEARLQMRAGQLDDALAIAEDARTTARATGYAPLDTEAEVEVGTILSALGRTDEAEPLLQRGFEEALRHRDQRTAATSAIELAELLSSNGVDEDETEWLSRAAVGLAQGDGSDVRLIARALLGYGDTHLNRDLEHEADAYYVDAIGRLEQAFGPDHPDLLDPLMARGDALALLQRRDEAFAVRARALAIAEGAFGPDHPQVAVVLGSIGFEMLMEGQPIEAQAMLDRSYEINAAAFAPDHPAVMGSLASRAGPLARQGKFAESIPMMEEALRRMERTLPELHYSRINTMQTFSIDLAMSGDHTRAAAMMREVVRLRRAAGDQGALAAALSNLGKVLDQSGDLDEAEGVLVEAARFFADARADDGFYSPGADMQLAELLYRRGKLERAREILEPAMSRIERESTPGFHAPIRLLLGTVLWETGGDRRRAVELVERALDEATTNGGDEELAAEARAWLDAHVLPVAEDPLAR